MVIFSEDFASEGSGRLSILLTGTGIARLPSPLWHRGCEEKLLEGNIPLEKLGGGCASIHEHSFGGSVVPEVDSFRLLFQRLSRPGWELILPRAEVLEAGGDERSPSSQINPARISGAAVSG